MVKIRVMISTTEVLLASQISWRTQPELTSDTVFINVLTFLRIPRSPIHQQLSTLGAISREPETKA